MFYIKINDLLTEVENNDFFSKNDLYVSLKYNNIVKNSTIKFNNNKPIWNETFLFNVNPEITDFRMELRDKNTVDSDRLIFAIIIDVNYGEIRNEVAENISFDYGNIFYYKDCKISDLKYNIEELKKDNLELQGKILKIKNIVT